MDSCPICKKTCQCTRITSIEVLQVKCQYCGDFAISTEFFSYLNNSHYSDFLPKLSSLTREWTINHPNHQDWILLVAPGQETATYGNYILTDFIRFTDNFPTRFTHKIDRILLNLSSSVLIDM